MQKRFPALDGLRGLAAVGVVFNHLGPTTWQSDQWWLAPIVWFGSVGWLGVDLFFVLSGFLITGILIENKTATNYFRAFYAHRALRILPIYFLLLIIWTIAVPLVAPQFLASISTPGALWPHWFFLTSLWLVNGHIGMAWVTPLAPSWSLSIEEQFYLVWAP
jgi:peptidoglycan/LPS O-acetylase OafA/YrhL